MHKTWALRSTWLALASTTIAIAAAPDPKLAQAATVVQAFDRLDAECLATGRYNREQQAQVDRWRASNPVEGVRSRVPELRADASLARQMDQAVATIVRATQAAGANPCMAASSLVKLPDAQFPGWVPAVAPATASPATPSSARTPTAPPSPRLSPELLSRIEGFGFDTRAKMGIGGFIALDIYPVVLFKSGELLTDVAALRDPRGIDVHRATNASDWSRWRRDGGVLQKLDQGKWEKLPFPSVYERLPDGLRLDGLFRSLGGVGNLATGGNQAVTVVDEYRFAPDGMVTRSGAVGSQAQAGTTSVVTRGGPGIRRGRYRVEGLVLRIDYDDGAREERLLITDPKDASSAIWLDGEAYSRRR